MASAPHPASATVHVFVHMSMHMSVHMTVHLSAHDRCTHVYTHVWWIGLLEQFPPRIDFPNLPADPRVF